MLRAALVLLLAVPQDAAGILVLKGARVVTVSGADVEEGIVVVEGGRIRRIAAQAEIPAGARVVELSKSSWIVPGFIDLHSHLGGAFDLEEPTEAVTPQVRAVEAFTSRHRDVAAALSSGVTTVALSPGNGNLVGGRIGLVKLNGERYDRALYREAVAIKASLGPQALRRDREPTSRAGAVRLLRTLLSDPKSELAGLPLFVHASTGGEIESALGLREAFRAPLVLVHAGGAADLAPRLRAAGVPVAFEPLTVSDPREVLETPAKLDRAGVPLAFVSDAPLTAESHLRVSASFAVKHGLDRRRALRALTLTPAEILGLQRELGSLEEGKEADLVVWSGDPVALTSDVELVVVGGKIVHRKQEKP
jgi:imidazolonepropionase-like amidohydrolase